MENNRKIFGIKVVSIFTYTNFLLFSLISFRAPGVNELAITYAVPTSIRILQSLSLYFCLIILSFSIILYFIIEKNSLTKFVNAPLLSFVIFHTILVSTDFYYSEDLMDFLIHLIFILEIYLYFGVVVENYFMNKSFIKKYIFSIYYGVFAFIFVNFVLEVGGLANMTWKGRFLGVTSQPNFVGVCCALCTVFSISLLMSKTTLSKIQKLVLIFGSIIGAYLCFMSGSRSSMLSIVCCSLILIFYNLESKVIRYFVVLMLFCICVFILFNYELFSATSSIDYTSRGNTREETWKELYSKVIMLPVFGFGTSSSATTNSYLFSIVATGIVGGFFFFRTIFLFVIHSFNIQKRLANVRYITYPLIGLGTLLFIVAFFEGIMLDSASMPVFVFWFLLSLK